MIWIYAIFGKQCNHLATNMTRTPSLRLADCVDLTERSSRLLGSIEFLLPQKLEKLVNLKNCALHRMHNVSSCVMKNLLILQIPTFIVCPSLHHCNSPWRKRRRPRPRRKQGEDCADTTSSWMTGTLRSLRAPL